MYAVLNMNYKPSEFANLPQIEKAFVIACINEKVDAENKRAREIERNRPRSNRAKGRRR